MSRRRALALGGFAALALPAATRSTATKPNPDANLIACCARWAEVEARYSAVTEPYGRTLDDPPPEVEAEADAFWREARTMLERIQATSARTEEGRRAKARVALRINLDPVDETAEAIAWGLLSDLLTDDPCLAAHVIPATTTSRSCQPASWALAYMAAKVGRSASPQRENRTPGSTSIGAGGGVEMVRLAIC